MNNKWLIVFVLALASFAVVVSLGNVSGVDSANIANGTIQEEDLLCVDVPADGEAFTYDAASGGCEWVAGGGGGGIHPVNVATDITGITGVINGGTGISTTPSNGNVLIGNIGGGYSIRSFTDCNNQNWYRMQYDGIGDSPQCQTATVGSAGIADNSIASIDILIDTIAAVDVVTGGIGTVEILDLTILPVDFASDDTAVDGDHAVWDDLNSKFVWEAPGAGGGVVEPGRIYSTTATLSLPIGWSPSSISTRTLISGQLHYFPLYVIDEIGVDALAVEVTTLDAGGLARACIYESDSDFVPSNLVVDSGSFSTAATGTVILSFSESTLVAGNYVLTLVTDGTVTFRAIRGFSTRYSGINPAITASPYIQSIYTTGRTAEVAGGCADPATAPANWSYASIGFYMPLFMRISTP